MKVYFFILFLGIHLTALAGYRHPIDEENAEIENTRAKQSLVSGAWQKASQFLRSLMPTLEQPALPEKEASHVVELKKPAEKKGKAHTAPETPSLKGFQPEAIRKFSQEARARKTPDREYPTVNRAALIYEKYKDALQIKKHTAIRTERKKDLLKISRIFETPDLIPFEQIVQRMDGLFLILENRHTLAIGTFQNLLEQEENTFQGKDSLFAAYAALALDWHSMAGNYLRFSADKKVYDQFRYVGLLLDKVEDLSAPKFRKEILIKIPAAKLLFRQFSHPNTTYELALLHRNDKKNYTTFKNKLKDPRLLAKLDLLEAIELAKHKQTKIALEKLKKLEQTELKNAVLWAQSRLLQQAGMHQEAVAVLEQLKRDSTNGHKLLEDKALAELKAGKITSALGKTIALQSPYFRFAFSPDIFLIDAMARKKLCDFGGAQESLKRFHAVYEEEKQTILELLEENPEALYSKTIEFYQKNIPSKAVRTLIGSEWFQSTQKSLNYTHAEVGKWKDKIGKRYEALPENWDRVINWNENKNKIRTKLWRVEAGTQLMQELNYMHSRIEYNSTQAELLRADISTNASRDFHLASAMNFPVRKPASLEETPNKLLWPYEQEIWEDELDYLRWGRESKCATEKAI